MNLGDKVHVILEVTGEVVGRTYEQNPKIDLKLPWGMLNGLPISVLTRAESVEEDKPEAVEAAAPTNVTRIRPAAQKGKGVVRAAG
jgi:hypothetical protein